MEALLDLLDSELEKVRQGEVADFELMRDIMVYMTRYPGPRPPTIRSRT